MQKITVTLETVTPLFLGGADARGEPELRPPAFRGAMRYWLRAALGSSLGGTNSQELYKRESNVFGGAANDDGGIASAVNVRLLPILLKEKQQFPQKISPNTGYGYLFWSLAESGEGVNHLDPKWFYPSGSKFEISLSARQTSGSNTTGAFENAIISLWLLVRLGGIGSRSRRLAGSLDAISTPESELIFQTESNSIAGVAKELRDGLRYIVSTLDSPPLSQVPEYDTISPAYCRIWVLGKWDSAREAQEDIGSALKRARQNKVLNNTQRAVFGLPAKDIDLGMERRSSPLWLKLSSMDGGKKYVAVATLFKSKFSPDDKSVSYSHIENWLEDKTVFPDSHEVVYA